MAVVRQDFNTAMQAMPNIWDPQIRYCWNFTHHQLAPGDPRQYTNNAGLLVDCNFPHVDSSLFRFPVWHETIPLGRTQQQARDAVQRWFPQEYACFTHLFLEQEMIALVNNGGFSQNFGDPEYRAKQDGEQRFVGIYRSYVIMAVQFERNEPSQFIYDSVANGTQTGFADKFVLYRRLAGPVPPPVLACEILQRSVPNDPAAGGPAPPAADTRVPNATPGTYDGVVENTYGLLWFGVNALDVHRAAYVMFIARNISRELEYQHMAYDLQEQGLWLIKSLFNAYKHASSRKKSHRSIFLQLTGAVAILTRSFQNPLNINAGEGFYYRDEYFFVPVLQGNTSRRGPPPVGAPPTSLTPAAAGLGVRNRLNCALVGYLPCRIVASAQSLAVLEQWTNAFLGFPLP